MIFDLPVNQRANFTAFSLASAPASEKNTRPPVMPDFSIRRCASSVRGDCAPARLDVAHPIGLGLDRGHDFRMLMAQVAAFGHAAQIEIALTVGVDEPCALAADDRGRIPVRLDRPRMQHGGAFFGGEF